MKANLVKYKHHIIILVALLVAHYVIMPLWELQQSQRSEIKMLSKQRSKINTLIDRKDLFQEELNKAQQKKATIAPYLFQEPNEGKFKLAAQLKLEQLLSKASCTVERISWKSDTEIDSTLTKWMVEARYNGNPSCIIQTTRFLAAEKPLMRVHNFDYSSRRINGEVRNKIRANLSIIILQNKKEPVQIAKSTTELGAN